MSLAVVCNDFGNHVAYAEYAEALRQLGTGERIRDKIAASKKKGMWMGGVVPFGYDVKDRKLVVNEDEAGQVRHMFAQLRAAWRESWRRPAPDFAPDLPRRGIAWKLQSRVHGALPSDTKRSLEAAAERLRRGEPITSVRSITLKPGARLVRSWRGKTHQVIVLEDGYEHEERRYTSLTQIAYAITGTRWSGPAFFGLKKRHQVQRHRAAHDWASTPLGAPDAWPGALKTAVRLILNTGHPMYIWWGPDLFCFYNDAYFRSLGPERHPGSLGQPGREVWAEIWPIIGSQIDQVMSGEGATWNENQLVPITRNGQLDDVYWTYSYSPIDDETASGGVGGVLVVCTETTQTVLAERMRAAEIERQRRLFEQAPGFIAVVAGPEHVFEFANAAYRRLTGNRDTLGRTVREARSGEIFRALGAPATKRGKESRR